ncbi:MAG: MFS transporter [Anaerolineaceae bacterium]|nr:MFS transporter [Anaerolineaceae bacterium]
MNSKTQARGTYIRLFREFSFAILWLGYLISYIGEYFILLAIPIAVERLTGSTLMVGLSVISEAIPMLILGPVAGVFVDRWNRKKTMVFSSLIRAALVLFLLLVQTPNQVWLFYVIGFLMSCVSRFFHPAMNAVLPEIITDKDDLLAANGLMQLVTTVGLLAGPALAGFSIGYWGTSIAFIVDSICLLAAASIMLFLRPPKIGYLPPRHGFQAIWLDLKEGVHYLFANQTMIGVMVVMGVTQLGFGAINVIWVPYLQRTFGIGAEGLGIVDSAQGAGMVLAGILLGFMSRKFLKHTLIGAGVVVMGLSFAAIGLAPEFAYIVAFSFIVGFGFIPAQSAVMTVIQLAVPDEKRGRVSSAQIALRTAAGLLSMAFAASLAETIGHRTIYIACGLIATFGGILAFYVLKEPAQTYPEP